MTHNTREGVEEKLAGKVVVCDGLYTGKSGTILGIGSSRHSIKLLIDGMERYEPDYALLHVTEDNEQAIKLLLSHHQELQKAREEERERIKKDLDRRLEIQKKVSSSEYEGGYTHALQDVKEAYQSELDQPTV